MRTDVTTPGSFAQSKALQKEAGKKIIPGAPVPKISGANPDYKVDLSSGAKVPSVPTPPIPSISLPSLPDLPKPTSGKPDVVRELAKDEVKEEVKKEVTDIKKVEVRDGTLKKPAIFFIKGLDVFSSPLKSEGGYAGLGRIAESVEGSRLYGWDQKTEIMKEIKKVHKDYPIILVGHSLGGDTAIEIADELDSLKEDFRTVDLLVTVDAVGFGHDIIPQNVKKHLNVFGENSFFLNDGPHVARREEKTNVRNILSPLDHTDIDDDKEIQFEIVDLIQKTLSFKISES